MSPLAPDFLAHRRRALALLAIAIAALTWAVDLGGLVYRCPYCQMQRSVIGLLGVLLLLPAFRHWLVRLCGSGIGFLGLSVAASQHFNHWKRIAAGTFEWGERWFIHPWLLSGAAVFIITGLLMILWSPPTEGEPQA